MVSLTTGIEINYAYKPWRVQYLRRWRLSKTLQPFHQCQGCVLVIWRLPLRRNGRHRFSSMHQSSRRWILTGVVLTRCYVLVTIIRAQKLRTLIISLSRNAFSTSAPMGRLDSDTITSLRRLSLRINLFFGQPPADKSWDISHRLFLAFHSITN